MVVPSPSIHLLSKGLAEGPVQNCMLFNRTAFIIVTAEQDIGSRCLGEVGEGGRRERKDRELRGREEGERVGGSHCPFSLSCPEERVEKRRH